ELADLEERAAAHVEKVKETAGKGKKAKQAIETAEREVDQWLYDLRERQKEEVEELAERLSGGPKEAAAAKEEKASEEPSAEDDEAERARRKKEKAQKKRQSRADKEAQKEAEKERERREAGPSARELELESLAAALSAQKPVMKIHEIPSD
ncbi:OTUD6B, partial [Symbiodinium sp. CCMP2456]